MSDRGTSYVALRTRIAMLALVTVGLFIALISSSAGDILRAAGIVTVGPRLTGMSGVNIYSFGYDVAIDGDTAAVVSHNTSRAVRIFKRAAADPANWEVVTDLIGSDTDAGDSFGSAVAIDGDTLVVGASGHNADIGAAYIFQRNAGGPGAWGQVAKLTPSNGTMQTRFGDDIDIDGDTIIIGGARLNNVRGAVYVFRYNAATANWPEVTILSSANATPNTFFGGSIAISGDTIVAGAPGEGDEPVNEDMDGRGAVYIFRRDAGGPGAWGQVAKLVSPTHTKQETFGQDVDISGDTIAIGSTIDDREVFSGVYTYQRAAGASENWVRGPKLMPDDLPVPQTLGDAVAIDGDLLIVGASIYHAENRVSGSVYLFQRDPTNLAAWAQVAKVKAFDSAPEDLFGRALGFDGQTLIVGAPDARPSDGTRGASYIFGIAPAPAPTTIPTATEVPSATASATATVTAMPTATATATPSATSTTTPSATVTASPTATATATTTLTAMATATSTLTASPTATATATATTAPTGTAIPSPTPTEPALSTSGGNRGGPGSEFVLAAEGFATNQPLTISVDDQSLTTISADGSGKLNFVIWFGPGTPSGAYWVTVASAAPALATARQIETVLIIDPNAPVLSAPASSGLLRISARNLVYLPLLAD